MTATSRAEALRWGVLVVVWGAGVVLIVLGVDTLGWALAGIGATGMLILHWRRGGWFFPDGGGPSRRTGRPTRHVQARQASRGEGQLRLYRCQRRRVDRGRAEPAQQAHGRGEGSGHRPRVPRARV
jgi:hypothetical protein